VLHYDVLFSDVLITVIPNGKIPIFLYLNYLATEVVFRSSSGIYRLYSLVFKIQTEAYFALIMYLENSVNTETSTV